MADKSTLFVLLPITLAVLAGIGLVIVKMYCQRQSNKRFEAWCKATPSTKEISAEDFHDDDTLMRSKTLAHFVRCWSSHALVLWNGRAGIVISSIYMG